MANELTTTTAGRFAVSRDDAASAKVARAVKEHGVRFGDLPKLLIPAGGGKLWTVRGPNGLEGKEEIELVIALSIANQKAWWSDGSEAGDGPAKPPSCSSSDGVHGRGNNRMDQDPVGNRVDHECARCPQNVFGSDRKGGKGKECKDFALLLGFSPDSRLPQRVMVPPTSLKAMRTYMVQEVADRGLEPHECITRLRLQPQQQGQMRWSTLVFSFGGALPPDEAARFSGIAQLIRELAAQRPAVTSADFMQREDPSDAAKDGADGRTLDVAATVAGAAPDPGAGAPGT